MTKANKHKEKAELELENIQFQKILKISLLMGIIIVSGFIGYYIWYYSVSHEEDHIGFGILNHRKEAEDYTTVAYVDQPIDFYVTVENELSREFTFKVRVYRGPAHTQLSSDGSQNAIHLFSTDKETLRPGEDWESDELTITFPENGSNQVLLVELWEYPEGDRDFYDILWLRIHIIS